MDFLNRSATRTSGPPTAVNPQNSQYVAPNGQAKTGGVRLPHLSGLDGLRALAVLAVVLYHADLSWIPGGFLGVEVFFVVSGYLITALLLAEWQRSKRIDLVGFWLRRARRLLPALYALLIIVLAFAVVVLPNEVAGLRTDALAAFAYITNWYLIFGQKSYFESVGRPSLLQHLWSLAVEEQFYLIWPILFSVGMRYLGRNRFLPAIIGGAVLSALLMAVLYNPLVDPSRLYFGTDTRASGLLIGAALAFVWAPRRRPAWVARINPLAFDAIGFAALGVLIWLFLHMSEYDSSLYQGGFVVVGLTTAIIIAVLADPGSLLGRGLLERQPLRWMGLRSYSIYLWHWPIVSITRPQLDIQLDGVPLLVLRLALTAVLAELSYRFVETPIRHGALGRLWRRLRETPHPLREQLNLRLGAIAAVSAVFALALGIAVVRAQPPAQAAYLTELLTPTSSTPAASTVIATPTLVAVTGSSTAPATTSRASSTAVSGPTRSTGTVSATAAAIKPTAKPAQTIPPGDITAFGDSVLIGASEELKKRVGEIDIEASIGLHFSDAISMVQKRHDAGTLGKVVFIHLGNNGGFTSKHFDMMMDALKGVPKIIFMNLKVPRQWEAGNNAVLDDAKQRYPNIELIDWHAASANHPELFVEDGFHLKPDGRKFYADLVAPYIEGKK